MSKPTTSINMRLPTTEFAPSINIRTSIWLYLAALSLTLFSVLFLDRGIASWMHQYSHASYIFKPLSQMPLLFEILSALVLICCITPKGREKFASLALTLTITLIMASAVRVSAKFAFGRTWPETWVHTATGSNPSWITDGVEGFHPFAQGLAYNSFPSGHALFTFALVSVFWWRFPRLKGIWMIAMLGAIAGQVGQNYHFLGDLLAGATFGVLAAHISINISRYLSHRYQAG
ncbi:PA-phosphatase [Shewanella sp. Choline-02u-19]|uniref:phosphatase PAP2 family protein n=1 Tax=unclassified Shewanella TaxID=196818 RepID=UPI000C349015|nr:MULTISPECIES: phosphatase PAP2 family protein [unclassified Shewanella]PKH58445.1 PA-phosphatase [Shewanella sp. Bg11-22]PKI26518.1 PA-phosphatase [Shewanella sp. Choline-02u-19]